MTPVGRFAWMPVAAPVIVATIIAGLGAACAPQSAPIPANGPTAQAAFPAVGMSWQMVTTEGGGARTTETQTATDVSFEGRSHYGISNGTTVSVRDPRSFNVVAVLRDGQAVSRTRPDAGTFSWPLWVGKAWTATFAFEDVARGRNWSRVGTDWRVTAYEDVTVPAGTFKAFKVQSTPGENNSGYTTYWYAPDARNVVKTVSERLPSHYLGAAKTTTELLSLPK